MWRLLSLLVISSLLLSGCGVVVVRGALNVEPVVASGVVSIVHLTFASDGNGSSITVTVVTLLQSGSAQDLTFCGSQVAQFPINTFVTAKFTQGPTCSTLISVATAH
jgi:hypothetical protein